VVVFEEGMIIKMNPKLHTIPKKKCKCGSLMSIKAKSCWGCFLNKTRTGSNSSNYKNGRTTKTYKCKICKKKISVQAGFYNKTNLCASCAKKSKRNPNFKHGLTKTRPYKRRYKLKSLYNITEEDFKRIYTLQKGRCKICNKHEKTLKRRLCIDHNHNTKKVRGLLCHSCNFILGVSKENVLILKRAIKYLNKKGNINARTNS